MTDNTDWTRLVQALDEWTTASELTPGRIEVSVPGDTGSRQVIIVMTEDEWDDIVGPMWGSVDDAIAEVKRTLMQLEPHHTYARYEQYTLVPATEATLPEEPDFVPKPDGRWLVHGRDGRPDSYFGDLADPTDGE